MRYVAVLFFVFSGIVFSTTGRAEPVSSVLTILDSDTDEMLGIDWYRDDLRGPLVNFYFGVKQGKTLPLRIKFEYTGSEWIFAKDLLIKVDGRLFKMSPRWNEWVRDNSGGTVWETIDLPTSQASSLVNALVNAEAVTVRFSGKYHFDYELSDNAIAGLRKVYWVWRAVRDPADKRAQAFVKSYKQRRQTEREEEVRLQQAAEEKKRKVECKKGGRLDNVVEQLLDTRHPCVKAEDPFD